ncbi:hypothetical protein LCGC14_2555980, partial [marine sediment metagenome]
MPVDEKALVLIVDDSTLNLKVLGNTLRGEGFSLAVAKSGREALEFVRKKLPDLILLDIMMPEMDGYAVCKRLKSGVVSKNVPVIFLTAKTDTDSIVRGFDAGGVDYVTKPFNTAELLARVRTQIRLKRASDEIKNEVVIPYISMHGSTKKMVDYFVRALIERNITVKQFNLAKIDIGKLAVALVDAATIVIGSPTVLTGLHPNVAYAVYLTNVLRPKLKFASIIGSYGWGGKMVEELAGMIPNLK